MNGQHFPESKRKIGENAPPFHPNCRCSDAPYDEDLKGIGERWARDVESGEGYWVPRDMTYEEWKATQEEKYGAGAVDNARKKAYNKIADREQYERWKPVLKEEGVGSFEAFQDKKYTAPDEYKQLVDYARYRKRVPEATKEDYQVYKAVKETGIYGTVRVPPEPIEVSILSLDEDHIKKRDHAVTLGEAKGFIDNALFSLKRQHQSERIYTNYYSSEGASYVDKSKNLIRTSFKRNQFNEDTEKAVKAAEDARR